MGSARAPSPRRRRAWSVPSRTRSPSTSSRRPTVARPRPRTRISAWYLPRHPPPRRSSEARSAADRRIDLVEQPGTEALDALLDGDLGSVAEGALGLGDVRVGDGHVAGLLGLSIEDRAPFEALLEELDETRQRRRARAAEVVDAMAARRAARCGRVE